MSLTDDRIIDDVLRRELPPGVTSWEAATARLHPADRGGWTRGGITAARWGQFKGWSRAATRAELDAITDADARAFYRHLYVRPFDGYPDPLRLLLIDYGVTSPHMYVFRALQQALRDVGVYKGAIDGVMGGQSREAFAAVQDHRDLYLRTLEYRARHYIAISFDAEVREFLRTHPTTQLHFQRGWLKRCLEFVYAATD